MNFFDYGKSGLMAEGVSVAQIAREVGTPLYIYSQKTLQRHFSAFATAFAPVPHLICYSVKANSNLAVLRTFSDQGSGFDIVSGGELYRVIKAGADASKIVFSGVGKTDEEIEFAIKKQILMFNVESQQELRAINRIAKRLGTVARFSIRVNPDVDPKTHAYISTGLKENKFGISVQEAVAEYAYALKSLKNLKAVGIDCHIGSQLTTVAPFIAALEKIKKLIVKLRKAGTEIKYLDMGGGIGITYDTEEPPLPSTYAKEVIKATAGLDVTLVFEPGRVMAGNAGILVTKVIYTKESGKKRFIVVDAGMNDLTRPSLYGSFHAIKPVRPKGRAEVKADIVGPICESGDFLAKDRTIEAVEPGELLAVMSAGAYGYTMSSNYNSRPRAAEVMVVGKEFEVVRARETVADLVRGEHAKLTIGAASGIKGGARKRTKKRVKR
jgi:diaminopimelate decarboxylase